MKPKKLNLLLAVFVVCMFIFSTIGIQLSTHSSCKAFSTQNHYYAFGYIDWFIQRRWIRGKVTFANPDPDYPTPNSSANQTIWATTNNSADSWAEAGYAKGWEDNSGNLDPDVRTLYQAYFYAPTNDYHEDRALTPPGSPGTVHTYTILYNNASSCWYLSIDGYYERPYPQLLTLYSKEIDIGLESMDHTNACREAYPTNMSYCYENQGWYSFGQAMPKIYTSDSYYHFNYTNSNKDSGVDYNDYYPSQ